MELLLLVTYLITLILSPVTLGSKVRYKYHLTYTLFIIQVISVVLILH